MTQTTLFKRIYHFLGSLKLAVVLLVLLCVLMALATWLEKLHGATFAQWTIYDSPFFFFLFILLFVNILVSGLARLPFRKSLMGFYIIHLGILILLAGMSVSKFWGCEGTMNLLPREPTNNVTTHQPILSVYFLNTNDDDVIHIKKNLPKKIHGLRAAKDNTILVDDYLITLTDFVPFADPHNVHNTLLPRGDDSAMMSARVVVTRASDQTVLEDTWFTSLKPAHVALSLTEMCVLVLEQAEKDLPFTITLQNFSVGTDPDAVTPATYTSTITIADDDGEKKNTITMNHPLSKEGFRFFQSSYFGWDTGELGSILSVNKDPGRWIKYLGSGLLVLGCLVHWRLRRTGKHA